VVVGFIGGGNRSTLRKPLTCRKLLTKRYPKSKYYIYTLFGEVIEKHVQESCSFLYNYNREITSATRSLNEQALMAMYPSYLVYHITIL
jgi:hypothetical protein